MKAKDRVRLTPAALLDKWRTGDIGTRTGTVEAVDGFIVVLFDGMKTRVRLKADDLEEIENG